MPTVLPAVRSWESRYLRLRQLSAIAHITGKLRSRSDQTKAVTAVLDRGDVSGTFEVLQVRDDRCAIAFSALALAATVIVWL